MVLAGYTVVGEFHYVHHAAGGRVHDDPNVMGKALISAAREAGIRLLDETPRTGAGGKQIVFLHPKSAGGVLMEICSG